MGKINCNNLFTGTEGGQGVGRTGNNRIMNCYSILSNTHILYSVTLSQLLSVLHGYYYSDFKSTLQVKFHTVLNTSSTSYSVKAQPLNLSSLLQGISRYRYLNYFKWSALEVCWRMQGSQKTEATPTKPNSSS